ncbi:ABC transporter permease, partial [Micrococcus luteus]|nr:ABC transporter permease [Micrococcus luteus]
PVTQPAVAGAAVTGAAGHAAAPSTGVQEAAAAAVADPQAPTTQPTDAAPTHRPHEQKGDAR